jgi:hypothetical protein
MSIALWVAQSLLALVFLWSAYSKGTWSRERLVAGGQTGVQGLPVGLIRFIAGMELLGALGLLLPGLTGVAPFLTALAAVGLGAIMLLAAATHVRLHELGTAAANLLLLGVCVFVVVGRS